MKLKPGDQVYFHTHQHKNKFVRVDGEILIIKGSIAKINTSSATFWVSLSELHRA